ncbi:MAG: enoyl-CoA hydratase-related protein [Candidatus Bathyarchaeia archaeon]
MTSQYKNILYEKKDGIATITINRPQVLNALNKETLVEIRSAIMDAEKDENVKVVMVTGAGDRAFCAGADVSEMSGKSPVEIMEFIKLGQETFSLIENLSKPVIAVVNGFALGGGCELAAACDLVISSDKAMFGQPEINLGIIPGWGGTQRLVKIVGVKKAKELVFLGKMIKAEEAQHIGLVNKVVQTEKLMEEANAIARELAGKSSVSLKFAKMALNKALEEGLSEGLEYERLAFALLYSSEDAKEGIKAFLEKRKPVWRQK